MLSSVGKRWKSWRGRSSRKPCVSLPTARLLRLYILNWYPTWCWSVDIMWDATEISSSRMLRTCQYRTRRRKVCCSILGLFSETIIIVSCSWSHLGTCSKTKLCHSHADQLTSWIFSLLIFPLVSKPSRDSLYWNTKTISYFPSFQLFLLIIGWHVYLVVRKYSW